MKKNRRLAITSLLVMALVGMLMAACGPPQSTEQPAALADPTARPAPAIKAPGSSKQPAPQPALTVSSERVEGLQDAVARAKQQILPPPPAPASARPSAAEALTRVGEQSAPKPAPAPAPAAAPASAPMVAPAPSPASRPPPVSAFHGKTDAYGYSTGGSATVNDAPYDSTFLKHYGVNPFIDTEDDHLSTFAMDVDTASYSVARRFIQDGHLPAPEAVRVEEFVNYFKQGYGPPDEQAFAIHMEGSPSPFGGKGHWLLRVGLQGRTVTAEERKDTTLIFVIDTSGSMRRENRLELVKSSLRLLVGELRPADEVGIVIYGSRGSVLLEPTGRLDKDAIMEAVDALQPGGSTNAAEGLVLGYEMAIGEVSPGRVTRVILLSDGVANVGRTGSDSILELIRAFVEEGVTLSTVGFGMGNYNDILMEQLANDGNGNYSYVDTLSEARRIFVENLTGTLQVIASDAKVQVDFNPEVVSRYRLLGYENRRVADQDFRNDTVDAGEVGAGHSVTALYELKLHEASEGLVGTVYVRYQDPDSYEITEISRDLGFSELVSKFEQASPRFQLAATVAEYAEVLRESYWAQDGSLEHVAAMAESVRLLLPEDPDVAEFAALVAEAEWIDSRNNPVRPIGSTLPPLREGPVR